MKNSLSDAEALALNNSSPIFQNFRVGDILRTAVDQRQVRRQDYVRYVDGSKSVSGDGKTWDSAFATITEGIAAMNALSELGATLLIAPGFYIEVAGIELTASDCLIKAIGLPEDTVLFGSGTAGAVAAAAADLLIIKGGNNVIEGLGLYVHKDDKACIVFDDTGGGYAGSFNVIRGCYFSPQAQDGVGYGIKYSGGNVNIIEDNIFYGAKTAAILLTGSTGNPVRNVIRRNQMVGTAIGVQVTSANYNTLIKDNWFSAGSQSGENMTNAIVISVGMNAGSLTAAGNYFEQSAVNDISDSKSGGSVFEMNNFNGA